MGRLGWCTPKQGIGKGHFHRLRTTTSRCVHFRLCTARNSYPFSELRGFLHPQDEVVLVTEISSAIVKGFFLGAPGRGERGGNTRSA